MYNANITCTKRTKREEHIDNNAISTTLVVCG